MRYFYHIRTYGESNWQKPSNIIKEVSAEDYVKILENEKRIIKNSNHTIEFWHEPFSCEKIPKGKRLWEVPRKNTELNFYPDW